jgi:hypothetical protein
MFLYGYNDNEIKMNDKFENERRWSSSSVSPSMATDAVRLVCEDDAVLDLTSFFLAMAVIRKMGKTFSIDIHRLGCSSASSMSSPLPASMAAVRFKRDPSSVAEEERAGGGVLSV